MRQRTVQFFHLWMELNDLLDGRPVDQTVIKLLATQLFSEAEAQGITDTEIAESWDELHRISIDIIRRRHRAPRTRLSSVRDPFQPSRLIFHDDRLFLTFVKACSLNRQSPARCAPRLCVANRFPLWNGGPRMSIHSSFNLGSEQQGAPTPRTCREPSFKDVSCMTSEVSDAVPVMAGAR